MNFGFKLTVVTFCMWIQDIIELLNQRNDTLYPLKKLFVI